MCAFICTKKKERTKIIMELTLTFKGRGHPEAPQHHSMHMLISESTAEDSGSFNSRADAHSLV